MTVGEPLKLHVYAESLEQEAASHARMSRPFLPSHADRRSHEFARTWMAPYSVNAASGALDSHFSGAQRNADPSRAATAQSRGHPEDCAGEASSLPGPPSPATAFPESEPLLGARQRHASSLAHPPWQSSSNELSADLQGEQQ